MDTDLVIRPFAAPDFEELTEVWHNANRSAYPYVAVHQQYTLDEARAFFAGGIAFLLWRSRENREVSIN
jgi:hypothetical protein